MPDKNCPFCSSRQSSNSLFCSQCSNPLEENISVFSKHKTTIIITALVTRCAFLIAVMIGFSERPVAVDNSNLTVAVSDNQSKDKTSSDAVDLKIKGNKNSKIYHTSGYSTYSKVSEKNRVVFRAELEAINKGASLAFKNKCVLTYS